MLRVCVCYHKTSDFLPPVAVLSHIECESGVIWNFELNTGFTVDSLGCDQGTPEARTEKF